MWSLLFLSTLSFGVLGAGGRVSSLVLFNYFIFQEMFGFLFLLNVGGAGHFFVLAKLGVAPLHFWGFYLLDHLYGSILVWFLIFQKMSLLPALVGLLTCSLHFLLLGLLVLYRQLVGLVSLKGLVFVTATEGYSWLLFTASISSLDFFYLSVFYGLASFLVVGPAREGT